MKVRSLILLLFLLPNGCRKEEVKKQSSASPAPTPVADRAADRHHLAPEGVFFLMERVSFVSDSGVTGFAPGTRVRLVQDKGNTFRVTDGTTNFDVPVEKLTDDIDLGTLVARHDAESQRAVADYIRHQNEIDHRAREANIEMLEQQQHDVDASRLRAAEASARTSNRLERGAYHQTGPIYIYRRYPNDGPYYQYP
jgi:hypothetical protein